MKWLTKEKLSNIFEIEFLVAIIVVPSIITFASNIFSWSQFVIFPFLLYVPLLLLILYFKKDYYVKNFIIFNCILIYVVICYLLYGYYDVYSDTSHGILYKIVNGYSSFFGILFFVINYKSKNISISLAISTVLILLISILSLLTSGKISEAGYDMNFGYKMMFCAISAIVVMGLSKKKITKYSFLFLSIACLALLIFFGSRGPFIAFLIFIIIYYVLFFRQKLSSKAQYIVLFSLIGIIVVYTITSIIMIKMPFFDSLPRNVQSIFNPLAAFTNSTATSRYEIIKSVWEILSDTPFFGYGMLADQYFLGPGRFSHNIVIEFFITFGIVPGTIIFTILIFFTISVFRRYRLESIKTQYFLIFFALSFGRLLVSYSFWYDLNFWIAIGVGATIISSNPLKDVKHMESTELVENSNVKKKCYFIHFNARKMPGVSKKLDDQINELNRFFDTKEVDIKPINFNLVRKVLSCLPFFSIKRDYKKALESISDASCFYVRNTIIDLKLFLFLRKLKKCYPNAKLLVELNTYPYDKCEFARKNTWAFFYKDFTYRHFYKTCVDRFVVYGDFDKIWGVQTIKTINGLDFARVQKKKISRSKDINLVSVAQYQNHHGYDRLIKGLADYYSKGGKAKIIYHVVGDGFSLPLYKDLAKQLNLNDKIVFYGEKNGKELDQIYDKCDIAVATLGFHRIDVKVSSALKTREYLAKGMPIVYSGIIDVINSDFKFQYCAPNDDTNIDINKIVELYNLFSKNKKDNSKSIIEYGKNKASIEIAFKPIIEFLEK